MDFGIFGFSPEQVDQFRAFVASQQGQAPVNGSTQAGAGGQQQQSDSSGAANDQHPRDGSARAPVFMHNLPHNGVVCDVCEKEIHGFRYKCAQCADFDLCSTCEHQGHHAGHVMLRIPFPEQARDAIRKYLSNATSCPPSPPTGHRPHHGHHGIPDLSFFRRGHGHGRRSHGQGDAAESQRPSTAPGCPYSMGKREFKKWSKWMKRAAAHQHRSAEAYARAASASGAANATASGSDSETETPNPMDFTAVANQIQEFLSYWGIPVDVVELYDQFGNHGRPGTSAHQEEQAQSAAATGSTEENTSTGSVGEGRAADTAATTNAIHDEQPSTAATNLTENMQQMRIDENQNNNAPAPRRDDSLLMDLDTENSGWTILNDSREQTPATNGSQLENGATANAPPQQTDSGPESSNSNNGKSNQSFASAAGSASSTAAPTSTGTASNRPAGVQHAPLYPILNQPQIQQILQGVSSAMNSVVRNIPIVTDPRGPMGTNVSSATTGQVPSTGVPASAPPAGGSVELDARAMRTLNQLLAMGFSNEGGYLTRLVVAKNGDLEAVLGSLFPN